MPKKQENKEQTGQGVEETPKPKKEKKELKKLSQSEYEKKVIEFAGTGLTAEKIGQKLRDSGIHPKDYSKKISEILKQKNLYTSPDFKNVESKLNRVAEHYNKNKQDKRAKREKDRIFSQLRKIKKYLGMPLK